MAADDIVKEVADRVREALESAEKRAGEIVREAEEEARKIRARAESEATQRLDEVRAALDRLQGAFGDSRAPAGASPQSAPTEAEVEPGPVTVPEPEPPVTPEPGPVPVPEPEPPAIPEPTPPPDEGDAPSSSDGDAAAARLVAMKMALEGASREEIDRHLADAYGLDGREALLDDVMSRVKA